MYKITVISCSLLIGFVTAKVPILSELSPIFSKGQNIMPKDSFTHYNYLVHTDGNDGFKNTTLTEVAILAPSERFSILFGFPITSLKNSPQSVTGLSDIYFQIESALYLHETPTFYMYTSLIVGAFLPSGKNGLGRNVTAPYIGGVTNYNTEHLYAFGVWLFIPSTTKSGEKTGANFFYEGGFGIPIIFKEKFLSAFILQINGLYSENDSVHTIMNDTTGANTLFIGPTFQIMTNHLKFQAGYQYPIANRTKNPLRPKEKFRFGLGISYYIVFG